MHVALVDDIEEAGLVASTAHPGRNITGISVFGSELDEKWLELLMEMVPAARRLASLAASKTRPSVARVAANAHMLGIDLVVFETQGLDRLADILAAVSTAGVDAVNVLASSMLYNAPRGHGPFSASQLTAIYQWTEYAAEGGLMGYGPTQALISRLVTR